MKRILEVIKKIPSQWLFSSIGIGLIPLFIKVFIALSHADCYLKDAVEIVDFIVFGLVLCLSSINQINYTKMVVEKQIQWKERNIIGLVCFLVFFSCTYVLVIMEELALAKMNMIFLGITTIVVDVLFLLYSLFISSSLNDFVK